MVHRPDPVDTGPIKFALLGLSTDGLPFYTSFWTRDFTVDSPPVPGPVISAWVNVIRPLMNLHIVLTAWGWRGKSGTVLNVTAFDAPVSGTASLSANFIESASATLSYGGLAIDNTGATRNIRSMNHFPRGMVQEPCYGIRRLTRSDGAVADYLDWFATMHPTDNFGRALHIYPYMDLQNNAVYQNRSGF